MNNSVGGVILDYGHWLKEVRERREEGVAIGDGCFDFGEVEV